jgi:oligopeptide transport system substrate-binding protein
MRLLAPLLAVVIALAAVVWLDDTPPRADLVYVNQGEVFTLDPQRMSYMHDLRLAHALYDGLARWNNRDFSILPATARAPKVSADGRTYVFEIEKGARWSNGDQVTAHDFIYSWRRAILPDTAADYSNMFFVIEGAAEFFEWRTAQTRAFVADPWAGDPDAAAALRTVERLRGLLAAAPRGAPLGPDDAARGAIESEIAALAEAAALGGGDALARALRDATATPAWLAELAAPDARAAEVEWMWAEAQRRFHETVGLEALDDRTLAVTLARPTAYFLDLVCFSVFFPVHRPTVEGWEPGSWPSAGWHSVEPPPFARCRFVAMNAQTGKLEQRHDWARPGGHVGNGPYVLEEWRYKRDLRLRRSATFLRRDAVKSETIQALTIEDTNTAVLAYESGQLDWLADVETDYVPDMLAERDAYLRRHGLLDGRGEPRADVTDDELALLPPPGPGERRNIHSFPTFGIEFFSFNCRPRLDDGRPNPFADPAVRRAFARAVNKEVITRQVTRMREPTLTTLIPPGSIAGYASPRGLAFDADAARRELAAAGWSDSDGDGVVDDGGRTGAGVIAFPIIDLLYTTNVTRYKWISLELKAQWERELGVRVELRPQETKFYKEDLKLGKFMVARGRWYGDYGDPTTFLDLSRTNDGNNDRGYSSAEYDRMLDAAADEPDPVKRLAMLSECERRLVEEDMPMLVLYQLMQVYMYEPGRLRGLSTHPRLMQLVEQMEVAEAGSDPVSAAR